MEHHGRPDRGSNGRSLLNHRRVRNAETATSGAPSRELPSGSRGDGRFAPSLGVSASSNEVPFTFALLASDDGLLPGSEQLGLYLLQQLEVILVDEERALTTDLQLEIGFRQGHTSMIL